MVLPSNGPGRRPDDRDAQRPAWWIYQGTGRPLHDATLADLLPAPPPWRDFRGGPLQPAPPEDEAELTRRLGPLRRTPPQYSDFAELNAVNSALYLRRPLLVTGAPGIGKSSLAYRISRELRLGRVLRWPITSRSTLLSGLYAYDPIARVQDIAADRAGLPGGPQDGLSGPAAAPGPSAAGAGPAVGLETAAADSGQGIGDYLQLGPLGTALLPYQTPRVLLIDELDKGNLDLANDLLDVFEEGEYRITELFRLRARQPEVTVHTDDPGGTAAVAQGHVRCRAFPIIVMTSNGEREFPAAFRRRCLPLELDPPDGRQLGDMVAAHFAQRLSLDDPEAEKNAAEAKALVQRFLEYQEQRGGLATDQLLNSIYLATSGAGDSSPSWSKVLDLLWQRLTETEPGSG
ncbi:MoxR-like ATPase [Spinactinospora alkalitolerans]|uniref:MoxR-like ATPase n=1 Tax=Spinactinospora alkalitolerans TaxID=687207 RepID=A0A852TZ20_9ACTN|nr:MoxR family ATPase [Spinactinospora alkalitolerans]NYE48585.1 MoxR-like ATPase [Spinactinospora alkalitolerans]